MSYDINEITLKEIMHTLRYTFPELQKSLHDGHKIESLHGHVEMLHALIELYERGEIVRKQETSLEQKTSDQS
ncbi:MAG: hypothetical protein CMH49_02045 [Myxococcales bacterium]|nr:hypothetical protein [Myxococcales bacterium]